MTVFRYPTAVVESNDIEDGAKIWHFVHVQRTAKIEKIAWGKSVYIDIGVEIEDGVKIQNFVSVYKEERIADDVFISPLVIFMNDLYPRAFNWGEDKITPIVVKEGVSIGASSTIVYGVAIGKYTMIEAFDSNKGCYLLVWCTEIQRN